MINKLLSTWIILCLFSIGIGQTQSEYLEVGAIVEASLTATALENTYMVALTSGDRISLTLSSRQFDPLLSLLDTEGNTLISNDDSNGSLNSRIDNALIEQQGDYTIVVTSSDGEGVGEYELEYTKATSQTIEFGVRLNAILDEATLEGIYEFEGEEGDIISIQMNSEDFDSYLTLSNDDGELASDDDGAGSLNALISSYLLPETGTYYIRASSFSSDSSGDYDLLLNQVETASIELNQIATVTIDGNPVYYSFTAQDGDVISVLVRSEDGLLDTSLNLQDSSGYSLYYDDNSGYIYDPEVNDINIYETGQYIVILFPPDSGETGEIELEIVSTLTDTP